MKPLKIHSFRFEEFEIDGAKRLLLKEGKPIAINSKTFDLLEMLIENRGEVLSKDELIKKLWEDQFVEESNLTVHISTLRKVLGENRGENRFIVTVPGKGYKFVGEAIESEVEDNISPIVSLVKTDLAQNKISGRGFPYLYLLPVIFLLFIGIYFLWQWQNHSPNLVPFSHPQIRQLTNNGKVETAALSLDGKLLAYVINDFGQKSLWLGQTDGGNNIQLRPPSETDYNALAFAPDNDKLYFSIRDEANPKSALFRMPVFGGAQEKLIDELGSFALSFDGRSLAFQRYKADEKKNYLVIADVKGESEKEIASEYPIVFSSISFSADGKKLAFGAKTEETTQSVFIADIATAEVKQITAQNFGDINKTAWLNDGSGLIITALGTDTWSAVPQFRVWNIVLSNGETRQITTDLSSYRDALSLSKDSLLTIEHRQINNIWIAPAEDLSKAKQITFGSFGRYDGLWGLDWTPDGRIIFNSSDTKSQVISVMNADGSGQKQLTAPGHIDSDLDVSNDGRYIVFHSTRGGGFDIWRMESNGDHPKQLTFSKKNYQPTISPDSRFVYYKSWENGVGELRRISIDGGESVALTDKETSWFSVSPDGKNIGALYRTDKSRFAILPITGGQPIKTFDLPKSASFYGGTKWTPDGKNYVYFDLGYGYWKQSIEGGDPQRIENLPKERLYNFAWSNDGKQFAFVRGQEIGDVILITDTK